LIDEPRRLDRLRNMGGRSKNNSGFGRRIARNLVLLVGSVAAASSLTGCNSGSMHSCEGVEEAPYNFAKSLVSKAREFEKTPYVYKLEEGNSVTFVYPSGNDIQVFIQLPFAHPLFCLEYIIARFSSPL
jgi:hypothetical protein